jgi:hypothetical protein
MLAILDGVGGVEVLADAGVAQRGGERELHGDAGCRMSEAVLSLAV